MMSQQDEMPLKAMAKKLGLTKSTLNYYRSLGLITPSNNFRESKIHLYSIAEIRAALEKIKKQRAKGFTLIEIAQQK